MVPIDHFDAAAELRSNHPAIIDDDLTITYGQLTSMSIAVAGYISGAAMGDDPVPSVIYSPNDARVLVAMVGILRAGGVIVPLHSGNAVATSVQFLQQVQPRCMFYHSSLKAQVAQICVAIPSIQQLVCLDSDGDDVSLKEIITRPPQSVREWIDCCGNRSRPVYYWATSGTSGTPKAVVEDCGCFDVILRMSRGRRDRRVPIGTTMALAPMSHGGGPSAFATLTLGGTVLVRREFDAREVLEQIQLYRVTELWLSPTALTLLLDYPNIRSFDLSSLRCALLGTAGIGQETLKRAVATLGSCVAHSYGQIEANFITFFDTADLGDAAHGDHPHRLLSSGRSMNVNRIAVMDDDGTVLPIGGEGEIVVRGPCVKRYLDAELTTHARRFGWHHTGDRGYVDEDGFLYVTGRIKDIINVAGFKVASAEVERVIQELPEVQECAVVSAPDPIRGEVVRAVITLRPGYGFDKKKLLLHCRSRLEPRKVPVSIEQWDVLPRSPAGKIDKGALRGLGAAATEPLSAAGTTRN